MDKKWFDIFSDRHTWEELVQTYIETGTAPGKTAFSRVADLWDYFKFCILTENRYFFDHPLLDVVKKKIAEHIIVLPENSTVFRARVDSGNSFRDLSENLLQVRILEKMKEDENFCGEELDKMITRFTDHGNYETYREQYELGFEGFDASGCMLPPSHKTPNGRCNLPYSPHLYATADIHTAIAEIRPYISDTVSVASLYITKELKIADFCFDFNDQAEFSDWFYMAMSSDFSAVNKGKENDYFATQYLTMLVKHMGYDGLRFKSSLVMNGINYVIFNQTVCRPLSSKLYTVAQVHYDVLSVSMDTHLKDTNGDNIKDPPLSRL